MTDTEKFKRKTFATWLRTNFKKEGTLKILFCVEKIFDIDGVCNAQNNRMWAVDRDEADEQETKMKIFLKSYDMARSLLKKSSTIDYSGQRYDRYIREVLPVAIKYGNKVFGDDWTYQQDNATLHTHNLTQE